MGRVTPDLLKKALPAPGPDALVMVCGPPGMMQAISGARCAQRVLGSPTSESEPRRPVLHAGPKAKDYTQGELAGALKELNYTSEQVFKF